MKPWVTFALIAMLFAGFTSVVTKIGLQGISSELGLAIRTSLVFVIVAIFAFFTVPHSQLALLTSHNYIWLGLASVTTAISWIFYFKALHDGEVSTLVLIDKGSMVVAVILAYFLLNEQITWRTALGGSLIVGGLLVLARR